MFVAPQIPNRRELKLGVTTRRGALVLSELDVVFFPFMGKEKRNMMVEAFFHRQHCFAFLPTLFDGQLAMVQQLVANINILSQSSQSSFGNKSNWSTS